MSTGIAGLDKHGQNWLIHSDSRWLVYVPSIQSSVNAFPCPFHIHCSREGQNCQSRTTRAKTFDTNSHTDIGISQFDENATKIITVLI